MHCYTPFVLVIVFSFLCSVVIGQTRVLKCQFYLDGKPARETISGKISDSGFKTNDIGICSVVITDSLEEVPIFLDGKFELQNAVTGKIYVPRKESYPAPVYVGIKGRSHNPINEIFKKIEEVKSKDLDLKNFKNEIRDLLQNYTSILDQKMLSGIQEHVEHIELLKRENAYREKLIAEEEARKRREGKMKTLNLIGGAYDHYLSKLKDLRDVFKFRGNKVFHDDSVVLFFNQAIKNYSTAYEEMGKDRTEILNKIEHYWQNEMLSFEVRQVLYLTLDEIHKKTRWTFNNILDDIDNYNKLRGKKRKRKKSEIKNAIRDYVLELSQNIENLEKEKERVYQKLKDN